MRTWIIITFLAAIILTGCTSGDRKAAALLDTAMFEEKQNNFEHASALYVEIIKNHPESPAAKNAAERLTDLNQRKP